MDRSTLEKKPVGDLREIAKQLEIPGTGRMRKAEIVDEIMRSVEDASGDDAMDDGVRDAAVERAEADSAAAAEAEQARSTARDALIERRRARGGQVAEPAPDADRGPDDGVADEGTSDDDVRDDRRRDRPTDGAVAGDLDDLDDSGDEYDDVDDDDTDDDDEQDGQPRNRARSRTRRSRGGRKDLDGLEEREGVLDLLPEGYGFLRTTGYVAGSRDVYVSQSYVRRFNLRRGDLLGGPVRYNKGNDKFPALARLETCEGRVVENEHDPFLRDRPDVEELVAVHPTERLRLGGADAHPLLGAIDDHAPQALGQRTLVVADRGAGATTLLVEAARQLAADERGLAVLLVLVGARPEEITEVERTLDDVEVIATPFDLQPEDHTALAELAVERARRLAERGEDVVVLLDSLTSLARAYHQVGQGVAGTLDATAVLAAKQLFGAGRALDGAGSVTVIGVLAVDPEAAADAAVVEEFRGAATSRIRLLGSRDGDGVPTLDAEASGTRRAELID